MNRIVCFCAAVSLVFIAVFVSAAPQAGTSSSAPREQLLRDFRNPSPEYAPIDTWWWDGGRLSKEKMTWQLEELKTKGVGGTWFYPRLPQPSGDAWQPRERALGSDPPYWTDRWWEFMRWSAREHQRLGLKAWFSDWTSRRFFQDRLRDESKQDPALVGRRLVVHEAECLQNSVVAVNIPPAEEVLDAAAYRKTSTGLDAASRRSLRDSVRSQRLAWVAPSPGWVVVVITSQPYDLDYLNRRVADRFLDIFLEAYARNLPEYLGEVLAAYGPDELYLLQGNILYSSEVITRVRRQHGYDITPHLVALFYDIGDKTEKVRCDYHDEMAATLEENFYAPISQWLERHQMQYVTIAVWGRGNLLGQALHYGDFFRYMRWFHVTGNEDAGPAPPGQRRFHAKLSSAIADLSGRRSAVCAYWGSGWGMSLEQNLAWTNENYAYGINLYNQHGGMYTLMGGWYEWVPPSVDFYQPYWQYWKHFTDYVRRLSYIMSQGRHRSDVALLYPQTELQAGRVGHKKPPDGALRDAVRASFTPEARRASESTLALMESLYRRGIDLGVVDHNSLEHAKVMPGKLIISGLEFRAVVLPPMTTVRTKTLQKLKEFADAGGVVVFSGRLPQASAEVGRNDPEVGALIGDMRKRAGKVFYVAEGESRVPQVVASAIVPDVVFSERDVFHAHRAVGDLDIYFLFNVRPDKRNLSVQFRASGEPEIWDAFTGDVRPIRSFQRDGETTKVVLDMEPYEGIVLVFAPGSQRPLQARTGPEPQVHRISLDGPFSFRLEPTMDNRWGDFRYPPSNEMIGPEARQFRYMEEGEGQASPGWNAAGFDDSGWPMVTYSYGPYWWYLGPFEAGEEPKELSRAAEVRTDLSYSVGERSLRWKPYVFSQRFGHPDNEAQADYRWSGQALGLAGVSQNFLAFRAVKDLHSATYYLFTNVYSPEDLTVTLHFGAKSENADYDKARRPHGEAWINGIEVSLVPDRRTEEVTGAVALKKGLNSVLLKVVSPIGWPLATYAVLLEAPPPAHDPYVPLLRWFTQPQRLIYDITPHKQRVGWYRFKAPPGAQVLNLGLKGRRVQAWVDGTPVAVREGRIVLDPPKKLASQVALRVEQEAGYYAGAAFPEPVGFRCLDGEIPLGDWSEHGLATYSGAALYTKEATLAPSRPAGQVFLDLGRVATVAEVHVNGKPAGVRMARPFRFDITGLVKPGRNQIRVKVANTLANHMSTYPTRYVFPGQTVSGLLGPVNIELISPVGAESARRPALSGR